MAMTPSWKVICSDRPAEQRRGRVGNGDLGDGLAKVHAGVQRPPNPPWPLRTARRSGRGRQFRCRRSPRARRQRHAQGLGGDLRQHGVGARADVGHALPDGDHPHGVDGEARLGRQQEVAADGGGHAHPHPPAAVAHLAGRGVAVGPAEGLRALGHAAHELADRETACPSPDPPSARCGCAARWDPCPAFRPARPWPLPGSACPTPRPAPASVRRRQVQLHQPVPGQPVRRGIEAAREVRGVPPRSRRRGRSASWSSARTRSASRRSPRPASPRISVAGRWMVPCIMCWRE